MMEAITAALTTAGPDFGNAVRTLTAAAAGAEPYRVMGAIAFYLGSSPAGTNPEHDRPLEMFQSHLELAQAVLFRDGDFSASGLSSKHVEELADAIKTYKHAWMLLQLRNVEQARTDEAREREKLLLQLRMHASTNRGWGYESRMDAMLDSLLGPLASLREQLGFAPADLPAWWRAMRGLANTRLQQHVEAMHEAREWAVDDDWVERIADRFGRLPERVPGSWTIAARLDPRAQEFYVINCADLRLPDIYRFTLDDLVDIWPGSVAPETVRAIVSEWAIRPDEYAGISMQTVPVDNPVVARPFVASGEDTWHLFCGWLPLHNPFGLIESALAGDDQALARYVDRRAQFLEERLVELLAAALPGATVE
jgi:hypothetical protein